MGDGFAFLFPVIFITLGCTFLLVWRWGAPNALWWGVGFLCSGVAATVPLLPSAIPSVIRGAIANGLFGFAFYCYGGALLRRAGAPMRPRLRLAILLVSVIGAVAAIPLGTLRTQIFFSDFGCALLLAVGLPPMLRRLRQPIDRALFGIAALVAFETFLQAATIMLTAPAGDGKGAYISSLYAFLMQSSAVVLGLVLALVALAAAVLDRIAADRQSDLRDPLTGLATRQGLAEELAQRPAGPAAACVACDVDNLKQAGEMFGPQTSERVIAEIAALVGALCPVGGVAARVGDHQFLLYLPTGGTRGAEATADRLRKAILNHDWKAREVVPTALAGLSLTAILQIDCHVQAAPR
jgi:GGDEF domain-containing protein